MAATAPSHLPSSEKVAVPPHPSASATASWLDAFASLTHPVYRPIASTYTSFETWKEKFGLFQPGTTENITREVKRAC
jgi:hypothetical protein